MRTILAILLVAAQAAPSYAGKPLDDVLRDLQRRGLNIVFSSELVKPEMKVASEPKATTTRQILDEVLAPHGLAVRSGPRSSFVVVGLVVKGLFWLFVIGAILIVATGIYGWVRRRV